MDRYFNQICAVLFVLGLIVLSMDLWVWRPN